MNAALQHEIAYKIIMIGDSGTGKSSLLIRYIKDEFNQDYCVTVGVEFATKKLPIDDNYSIKLQIWDTAGQQSFRSIVKSFYRNSAAVVLVYDITRQQTFASLQGWLEQSREFSLKNAIFICLGTHLDLQQQRKVKKQQVQQWVKNNNIAMHFETSSKSAENVNKAYQQISKQLFLNTLTNKNIPVNSSKINKMGQDNSDVIKIQNQKEENTKKCC